MNFSSTFFDIITLATTQCKDEARNKKTMTTTTHLQKRNNNSTRKRRAKEGNGRSFLDKVKSSSHDTKQQKIDT